MSFKRNIGYGNQYYTNNESFNRNNMQYRDSFETHFIEYTIAQRGKLYVLFLFQYGEMST